MDSEAAAESSGLDEVAQQWTHWAHASYPSAVADQVAEAAVDVVRRGGSPQGAYEAAVRTVHDLAHELCGGKLVVTGGGGYLASNVTRIYARTAVLLSGQTLFHGPEGPLPEAWREEFSRRTAGEEAPMIWGEIPPVTPSPSTPRETLRVVQGLERALGRELPPASGDAGSSPGTR